MREICENCGAALPTHAAICECEGRPARSIYFAVAALDAPAAEPFAVIAIDTSKPAGSGVEGRVESLHWSQAVAQQIAADLNLRALNDDRGVRRQ